MPNQTEVPHTSSAVSHFPQHPVDLGLGEGQDVERRSTYPDRAVISRGSVFRGFAFAVLPSLALWAGIAWLIAHAVIR